VATLPDQYKLLYSAAEPKPAECACDLRYARAIRQETDYEDPDGTITPAADSRYCSTSPVLIAPGITEDADEQMLLLHPGAIKISKPLVLMTEIQLRGIVDRLEKVDLNQKTDGDESMTRDNQTFSKYDHKAMELGPDVKGQVKAAIDKIFKDNAGEDMVFPTKNGAPKILTKFLHRPYSYELLPEYENGSKSLPSAKAQNWTGKTTSSTIIRDFVRNTPIVEPCPHPRCVSRLVIVPKFAPGQSKTDIDHGFRVTGNALMNKCLKPCASTIPLATGEIIKLHHCKYYLQLV
jgi:hypothetical protein